MTSIVTRLSALCVLILVCVRFCVSYAVNVAEFDECVQNTCWHTSLQPVKPVFDTAATKNKQSVRVVLLETNIKHDTSKQSQIDKENSNEAFACSFCGEGSTGKTHVFYVDNAEDAGVLNTVELNARHAAHLICGIQHFDGRCFKCQTASDIKAQDLLAFCDTGMFKQLAHTHWEPQELAVPFALIFLQHHLAMIAALEIGDSDHVTAANYFRVLSKIAQNKVSGTIEITLLLFENAASQTPNLASKAKLLAYFLAQNKAAFVARLIKKLHRNVRLSAQAKFAISRFFSDEEMLRAVCHLLLPSQRFCLLAHLFLIAHDAKQTAEVERLMLQLFADEEALIADSNADAFRCRLVTAAVCSSETAHKQLQNGALIARAVGGDAGIAIVLQALNAKRPAYCENVLRLFGLLATERSRAPFFAAVARCVDLQRLNVLLKGRVLSSTFLANLVKELVAFGDEAAHRTVPVITELLTKFNFPHNDLEKFLHEAIKQRTVFCIGALLPHIASKNGANDGLLTRAALKAFEEGAFESLAAIVESADIAQRVCWTAFLQHPQIFFGASKSAKQLVVRCIRQYTQPTDAAIRQYDTWLRKNTPSEAVYRQETLLVE